MGYSAGGGFDTYSRAIARHLARHVPGKPAVIVENMPGAAGLVAANSIYRAGKPDGAPATPSDRVRLLRAAFLKTLSDPAFRQ